MPWAVRAVPGRLYWLPLALAPPCHAAVLPCSDDIVPTCSVAGESCCDRNSSAEYVNVWSLTLPAAHDALLTTLMSERTALVAQGWTEVCNPFGVSVLRAAS